MPYAAVASQEADNFGQGVLELQIAMDIINVYAI